MKIRKLGDMIQEELSQSRMLQEAYLRSHWEAWAEKIAKYSEVHYWKEGILYVKLSNSMATQYMYMNKNKILKTINEHLEGKDFQVLDMKWKVEGKG